MTRLLHRLLAILILCAAATDLAAQDTTKVLEQVEVSSQRAPSTLRTAAPTQVATAESLEKIGAVQLSDAVRQMAGVVMKDYGGVGGMKTVSVRGLGSQFSTLVVDGVAVDNSQNGQVDLGRYLVGNAAYVSLSQGHEQSDLLSARAYAAGNVISLESAEPRFFLAERTNLKASLEAGSFGLLSPSLLWEQRWSRRLKSSLWVNYLRSDGDYPYTLYYTASRTDSSSREVRQHSAMHMLTADGSLFYTIGSGNTLTAKLHYTRGMHQLPGHVVYYRPEPSAQSTHEEAAFAQARWRLVRPRWKTQVLGKVQTTYDQFEDSAATGMRNNYMENHYRQHEAYLSGSAAWEATGWLDVSGAVDGDLSHLASNLAYRNTVSRYSVVGAVAAKAHYGHFEARANLLATASTDRVVDLDTTPTYRRLSPYASLMWTPAEGVAVRYFYKETYRVPNFSELYMFQSLPRKLRPERARQHNIGLSYMGATVAATVDAYFNRVTDKIVARPGQNMFYWSMENLGLVHILGIDATASLHAGPFEMQCNYTFAHAVDRTNPDNPKTYGHQIRYTPRHSGGGSARWNGRWVNLGLQAMVVGHRYAYQQNTAANRLPAYCDLGIGADRTFDLPWGTLRVQVQVLNLLDVQYEVVQFYPMMGRNFKLSLTYEL